LIQVQQSDRLISIEIGLDHAAVHSFGVSDAWTGGPSAHFSAEVKNVHDLTITQETFEFRCRACEHTWETEYETRRSREWAGAEMIEFLVRGLPVPSPYDSVACPSCRDIRTAVIPQIRSVRSATV
jgi:hypothetical protein